MQVDPPTNAISLICLLETGILDNLFYGVERVLKRITVDLLEPCARQRLREADAVTRAWCVEQRVRLAFLTSRGSFWTARLSLDTSLLCFFWKP